MQDVTDTSRAFPSSTELELISDMISRARSDHDAWLKLRELKREFRERELQRHRDTGGERGHVWPAVGTHDFSAKIRRVRSLHVPELLRGRTKLMTHQMLNRVFMGPGSGYNGVLLVHDTGTGKTRTSIAIAEQYANVMRNRACIVGPKTIRKQFKSQIVSSDGALFRNGRWELEPRAWGGTVYAAAAKRVRSPRRDVLDKRLASMVEARYEFFGWYAFAQEWLRYGDSKRSSIFSDRVIVVDEAHNLRPGRGRVEGKVVAGILRSIAKSCFNVKIVLLTATPMYDRADEIVSLINILRCNDDRPELRVKDVFPDAGGVDEEALRNGVRGYLSVYNRLIPEAKVPVQLDIRGARVPNACDTWPRYATDGRKSGREVAVMHHIPSSDAQVQYMQSDAPSSRDAARRVSERAEASNAVFPGGLIGRKGFVSVLDPESGAYTRGNEGCFAAGRLAAISPKAASIVERLRQAEGIVLVYSNFVWAGVKLVAAALEESGFRPCEFESGLTMTGRTRRSGPCYATLSDGAPIEQILEIARSPENSRGSRIKVLLCTKVIAEGADLTNIREVHIFDGWWNLSREAQVIGRAVRYGSHDMLAPEERNVTVFRYGLTLPGDREGFDHEMARMAMEKKAQITEVMAILASESFDCIANKREALRQLTESPQSKTSRDHVTSQGQRVVVRHESNKELEERVSKLCDGASLEIGRLDEARGQAWDVDGHAFAEVVACARDALGDRVMHGEVYSLGDLVRFTSLPDDIAIRAITEILHHALPLTPPRRRDGSGSGHARSPDEKNLIVLGEDEYTLSETQHNRHAIVVLPMALSQNSDEGLGSGSDWHALEASLVSALSRTIEAPLDHVIVDDMAIDRALATNASIGSIGSDERRGQASLDRARDLSQVDFVAQVSPASGAFVFITKRGASCSHMSRRAVADVLQTMNIPPPPASASKGDTCLYAEYMLRRTGMVARPQAARFRNRKAISNAHEDDGNSDDERPAVDQTIGTGDEPERLLRSTTRPVVNEPSDETRDAR